MAVRMAARGSGYGVALGLALMAPAGAARAGDGALEIGAACAAVGCFPGDAPGFPVQISAPGSYRLTSNLSVPSGGTAIEIAASDVTLDLAGFAIVGPGSCTGSGATLVCSGQGLGAGIHVQITVENPTIRNGRVRGFDSGVLVERNASSLARIEGLQLSENRAVGADGGFALQAVDSTFERNGGDGVAAERLLALRSVARGNGAAGFDGFVTALAAENIAEGNAGGGFVIKTGVLVGGVTRGNARGVQGGVAYAGNVISGNTVTTVGGGAVQMGTNVCGTGATCP